MCMTRVYKRYCDQTSAFYVEYVTIVCAIQHRLYVVLNTQMSP